LLTIDSTKVDPTVLTTLLGILYGASAAARMPLPDEVIGMFEATITAVDMGVSTRQPTYNAGTHVVTLPAVTGVVWTINGVETAAGAQPALTSGQVADIEANAATGYTLTGDTDWSYDY
jgi:hypothetical protein